MAERWAVVVALAVATAPAGANAPGYSLTLSGAPTGTVGTPYQITGSGTDPTDQGALYLEIDSFPASFTTTCPSDYLTASQEAPAAGGSHVAFDERENFDSNGQLLEPQRVHRAVARTMAVLRLHGRRRGRHARDRVADRHVQ